MDEEVVLLLKRLGLAFIVALIFVIPTALFFFFKFDNSTSDILNVIDNNKKVLVFVDGYKCRECKNIENILIENNIKYYKVNRDVNNQNYRIILDKIDLDKEYATAPSLILIENGELSVNINEFDKVDLEEFFIENNLL